MLSRLETMVLSGADLPVEVVRQQISSAIDLFVHLSRLRDRSRRVVEISEVLGMKNGQVELRQLFRFEEEGEKEGKIIGKLRRRPEPMMHTDKLQDAGAADWREVAGLPEGG